MNSFTFLENRYSDNRVERFFNLTITMVAILAISIVAVSGQEISRDDLIGHPGNCQHVMNLIHRHGVNQSFDRFGKTQHLYHSPLGSMAGSMMIPAAEMGDLEIISVHQMPHDDATCGPKIAVVVANQSHRCIESFSVTAVATLGRMRFDSPNKTVKVEKIEAGSALQVELVLPIESLAMGNRGGQPIGFARLVIAIDSFDELAETDEANNIKAYAIASVPVMTTAVVAAPTPEVKSAAVDKSPAIVTTKSTSNPLQTAIDQLGSSGQAIASQ